MKKIIKLVVFLLCISCTRTKDVEIRNTPSINLNPESTEYVNMSSFVDNIEFVKLSKENGKLIGGINKIIFNNERIYVLDSYNSIGLYVYNMEGNLLFDIAKYGRGPGEFMGPYDFAIDEEEGQIIIFDARGRKLCYYSIDDGSFIREELVKFHFRRFTITGNKFVFYLDNRKDPRIQNNIVITNRDIEVIDESVGVIDEMRGSYYMLPVNFSHYDGNVFFTAHSDNNIYKYNGEEFTPNTYIDFGERNLPEEYFDHFDRNDERREAREDAAYNISNYFETDKFKFFLYWVNGNTNYYLQSKNSERIIHTSDKKLVDDIGIGPLIRWPSSFTDNSLIWYNQPSDLIKFVQEKRDNLTPEEWNQYKKRNKKLIDLTNSLSASDNPYLIIMEVNP